NAHPTVGAFKTASTVRGPTEGPMPAPDPWADAQRIESWAGEVRVNLVRLVALLAFYGHHLVNVYVSRDDPSVAGRYHTAVTALVLAWAAGVLVLHYCLSRRWLPTWLKYAATAWDLLLITALLVLGRDPKSTLSVLYFLVIVAAALRLSLPLVYAATLGAGAAYLFFLGYARFWLELPAEQRLPRPQQIVFLLGLVVTGLLAGQVVRQARRLLAGYPVVVADTKEGEAVPRTGPGA